jgi:hypothetical protein
MLAGNSNLYDDTKNAQEWDDVVGHTSIFSTSQSIRAAGNSAKTFVRDIGSQQSVGCNNSPQAAGRIKLQASANDVTYEAESGSHPTMASRSAHTPGRSTSRQTSCNNAPGGGPWSGIRTWTMRPAPRRRRLGRPISSHCIVDPSALSRPDKPHWRA